jgi:hypothetical protein
LTLSFLEKGNGNVSDTMFLTFLMSYKYYNLSQAFPKGFYMIKRGSVRNSSMCNVVSQIFSFSNLRATQAKDTSHIYKMNAQYVQYATG